MTGRRAPTPQILLADDGGGGLEEIRRGLESEGIPTRWTRSGQEALQLLRETLFEIVAVQERLEEIPGAVLLRKSARRGESLLPVLLVEGSTGTPRPDLPPDTMVLPLLKPAEVVSTLAAAFRERVANAALDRIVGESEAIRQLKQTIRQIAPTKLNVLITGESGTGKELVAQAIHEQSPRRGAPFVAVNAGALPEGVLESELFGHERGAFTGAHALRKGRFELADQGTLFLDEIGDMPPDIQVKLLRVLEESRFLRVGGAKSVEVDVRLITATNRDLESAVESGRFRHDLYFRLNVINIEIPPLRERRADIPLLASRFAGAVARENALAPVTINEEGMRLLTAYYWPGNIRELRNLIEKTAVIHTGKEVGAEELEEAFGTRFRRGANLPAVAGPRSGETEREAIYKTLLALRTDIAEIKAILAHGAPAHAAGGIASGPLEEDRAGGPRRPDPDLVETVEAVVSEPGEPPATGAESLRFADLERDAIARALRRTHGNRRRAAALLGIGERTLYRKIREYRIMLPADASS